MSDPLHEDWDVDEPSPDFAGRVVAAAVREGRTPASRRHAIAVGVGVALAAAVLLVVWSRGNRAPTTGDVTAVTRTEVSIGDRGVAVLEPGAHVRWQGDHVEQERGDVFYRVERGASFTVHTPAAEAQVLGTCFRISIEQETEMKRRDVATGAMGAAIAAVVVVGVYEGKVRVSHADQAVTVRAGESAVADGTGVRAKGTTVAAAKPVDPSSAGDSRTEAQLRARLAEVDHEKALLESELKAANDAVGKHAYDLTADDWAKLAERGEFKYQYPCFQKGGFRPTETQLQSLGLPAQAADTIQQAYANSNARFLSDMKPICTELMGNDADLSACIQKLFQDIYTNGQNSAKGTFKQVAEIRAGKRPPTDATSPAMKMLLVFSGGMGPFEAELAKAFGADEAHRIAYSDELCFQAQSL